MRGVVIGGSNALAPSRRARHIRQAWRRAWHALLALLCLLVGAELGARALRVDDVPLYGANNRIGYFPAPDQAGAFLWTHRWAFNALSMGTAAPFRPNLPGSVLLIGDSIVLGGNPFRMEQRLGPQLAAVTGRPVWPVAAGSWALQNELQYLLDHPQVLRGVNQVVLVSNSGDFDQPSSWANELTHPRQRHWWVTWQLFRKYVWPPAPPAVPPAMLVRRRALAPLLHQALALSHRPWIVMLYPLQGELHDPAPCGLTPPAVLAEARVRLYCVKRSGVWRDGLYRGDGVHPTPDGTHLLALLIRAALRSHARLAGRRR